MAFALTHLAGIGVIAALFYATGLLIERIVPRFAVPSLGSFIVRVAVGSITWTYLLFGLASVGLFRSQIVMPVAGLAIGMALVSSVQSRTTGVHEWWRSLTLGAILYAVPALIVVAIFIQALSFRISWDDNVYHLTLPKLYLAHGGFRPISFSLFSHWPHNVELLFGLAMMLQDYVLAKLVHTLFLVLVLVAVVRVTRTSAAPGIAAVATVLVLGNPVVLFEARVAYVDVAFGFYLLVAAASAVEYLRTQRRSALVLSGVCCGMLAGTKLSGLAGLACIGALVLVATTRTNTLQALPRQLGWVSLALGLPTLLLALPWYAKSYLYTGNPIYPMAFEWFGGIEWSEELGRQFFDWQNSIGMGRSWSDYLQLPVRVVLSAGPGYNRFDGATGVSKIWLAAVPLAILGLPWTKPARPYLLCAGIYFVFWALTSQQLRFLIPMLPLLAVATAFSLDGLVHAAPFHAVRRWLPAAMLAATCATLSETLLPAFQDAVVEGRRLLDGGPADPRAAVPDGHTFINRSTPTTSRVMMLNLNRGFFLEREYIADSAFEASQMNWVLSHAASEQDLMATLRSLSITHLYLGSDDWGIRYPDALASVLASRELTTPVYRCVDGRCSIYELLGQ